MVSIVLALGGGGVRGIAHIGVIRGLENAGFSIKAVAGTSVGAIVGAVYASGCTPDQMDRLITSLDKRHLFARSPDDGPSLMGLAGLRKALKDVIGEKTFKDLVIPFACTSVDIHTDLEIIINSGRLMTAIEASAAVPGVFPPVRLGSYELVDGGVLDPVPVSVARWMMPDKPVIAVCLTPPPEDWAELPPQNYIPPPPLPQPILSQISRLRVAQAFNIFARSMDTSSRMLAELRLIVDHPDVIIRPDVRSIGMLDDVDPERLIKVGEEAVTAAMPEIQKAFSWSERIARRLRQQRTPGNVLVVDGDDEVTDTPDKPVR